ncbi:MAG: response regulator [Phycisphaerae bacterium]
MSHALLIVDDEPHILQSLKRLLRRDGYDIHLANSGPEALEILKHSKIAVIICDQRMPGMTGAEVLAESYKLSPDTIRITLTGFTDLTAAQDSINHGHIHHFLLKPWDDGQLRSVVAEAARAYALVEDNLRLEALTRQQKEELEQWNQQLEQQVRERTDELRVQNEHLQTLQRHVEQSLRDTVGVLAGVLETFSPNLGIHSGRVAHLARQIATLLELDDVDTRDIEFAAHLHDLGKITHLTSGLNARQNRSGSGKTPSGDQHHETGYSILRRVGGFEAVALGVRHQSEHFDGSGFPSGLEGENIPLASRIIAIADAYDSAVYHIDDPLNLSRDAGRKLLIDKKGRRFDPRLVDLFIQSMDHIGVDTDIDDEVEISPRKIREGMTLARPIINQDGILLLKEGTLLKPELIDRIQAMSNIDPLLARVFVRCSRSDTLDRTLQSPPFEPLPIPRGNEPSSLPPAVAEPPPQKPAPSIPKHETQKTIIPPAAAVPDRSTPAQSPAQSQKDRRKKILLVDDSVLICNALRRELRPTGIETVTTESGWTALSLVEQDRFDAALVDLMMPAMSGEELLKRLLERVPELPCIILTGNATKDLVVKLAKAPNVVGILTKPWDHNRLLEALAKAIQSEANLTLACD